MSQQQEMEFADLHMDGPESSYKGYRGPAYHEEYQPGAYRAEADLSHFISKPDLADGVNPTFMMQMRLGLIIVSLILWVIVFFGSIWAITKIPANLAFVLYPMVFLGLAIFTVLAAASQFFFSRRR